MQAAVAAYSESLRSLTSDVRVWANRSAAHLAAGNAAAALEDARIARTVQPDYAKARPYEVQSGNLGPDDHLANVLAKFNGWALGTSAVH